MKILALDLGKFNTMCCFYDTKTRKHSFLNATTDRNYLSTIFKKHKIDLVVMEACGPSGWINDLAVGLGLKTLVCSTNEEAWKWSNVKRKTDTVTQKHPTCHCESVRYRTRFQKHVWEGKCFLRCM